MRKVIMLLALSSLVIFSISTISFSQTPAAGNSTCRGDINEDDQVNIFDLLELLKMLGSMEGKTERQRQIADMDESGSVNIFDLLGLLRVCSGIEEPGIITWVVEETGETGSEGSYGFTELASGTYTITPSKSGYIFNPENVQVTFSGADVTIDYFLASTSYVPATEGTRVMQCITMVSIPGGTFQMGSTTGASNEQPVHQVTLSAFQMSIYEITQAQYLAVMGANPSYFIYDYNRPVETVTGVEVQTFCNKLSEAAGLEPCYDLTTGVCDFTKNGYRLPTEAEWEYACRAGTTTAFANGGITETGCGHDPNLNAMGWYCGNSGNRTHKSAQKQPNAWGLFDMHGNVWEWCQDWYGGYPSGAVTDPTGLSSGSYRVLRGGSWRGDARRIRSAIRLRCDPNDRRRIGFRLARDR